MESSEARIQQEIVVYFRNNYCLKHHTPRGVVFSVPNEREGVVTMKKLIQTGLMSGVSDLIVLLDERCIFVEVKNAKGRQSDRQKDFEYQVTQLGFEYYLVRSLEDFKKIL
jgi:hypothetical protein